jgi:hypothetical protein
MREKGLRWLLLGIALLLVVGCASSKAGQGLILYQVLDEEGGEPLPELAVADPNGKEGQRIPLSAPVRAGGAA